MRIKALLIVCVLSVRRFRKEGYGFMAYALNVARKVFTRTTTGNAAGTAG